MPQLNIPNIQPLDIVEVHNPLDEPFTTFWDKQPTTAQANETRSMLGYIAIKFAKEIADKVIMAKADATKKSIISFAGERIDILNQVLLRVIQPYVSTPQVNIPQEQVLKPGEVALNIGNRTLLQELGIPDTAPVSSPSDVASNIVSTKTEHPLSPEATSTEPRDPMDIRKEKEKLVKRAKELGIKAEIGWSLERIKNTILGG